MIYDDINTTESSDQKASEKTDTSDKNLSNIIEEDPHSEEEDENENKEPQPKIEEKKEEQEVKSESSYGLDDENTDDKKEEKKEGEEEKKDENPEDNKDELDSAKLAEDLQKFDEEHPKEEVPPDVEYDIDNDYDIDKTERETIVNNAIQEARNAGNPQQDKDKNKPPGANPASPVNASSAAQPKVDPTK